MNGMRRTGIGYRKPPTPRSARPLPTPACAVKNLAPGLTWDAYDATATHGGGAAETPSAASRRCAAWGSVTAPRIQRGRRSARTPEPGSRTRGGGFCPAAPPPRGPAPAPATVSDPRGALHSSQPGFCPPGTRRLRKVPGSPALRRLRSRFHTASARPALPCLRRRCPASPRTAPCPSASRTHSPRS